MNATQNRGAGRAGLLAIVALLGFGGGACTGTAAPPARSNGAMKDILDQMLRDSRQYYVPQGLPGRQQLLDQLSKGAGEPWKGHTPIQSFFIFEVAPEQIQKAPADVVQAAYCAALESLPGDWFTPYASINTSTSKRLMAVEGIDTCLLRQLDNDKRVAFGDSEPSTLAKMAQYQVGDLAALILGARHGASYDMDLPLADRKARREELKKQLRKG